MQIQRVLSTIEWTHEQFEPIGDILFKVLPTQLREHMHVPQQPRNEPSAELLEGLHRAGAVLQTVKANPDAVSVLEAFGLAALLDEKFLINATMVATRGDEQTADKFYREYYSRVLELWNRTLFLAKSLTTLVIPEDLRSDKTGQLLSVELTERAELSPQTVMEVLKATTSLYDAIAAATLRKKEGTPPLTIVKIESGTGLTINFKGVGEVVKETKNLIIEMWHKHRHKRVEEIINHNRAVASSIDVIAKIDSQVKKHAVPHEEGERLKRVIVSSTLKLFNDGALIIDVPIMEVVDNGKLLSDFNSPRLIAAADSPAEETTGNGGGAEADPPKPAGRRRKGPTRKAS
jgi:hypothetical protein